MSELHIPNGSSHILKITNSWNKQNQINSLHFREIKKQWHVENWHVENSQNDSKLTLRLLQKTVTCSKSTIETLIKGVKYVQS